MATLYVNTIFDLFSFECNKLIFLHGQFPCIHNLLKRDHVEYSICQSLHWLTEIPVQLSVNLIEEIRKHSYQNTSPNLIIVKTRLLTLHFDRTWQLHLELPSFRLSRNKCGVCRIAKGYAERVMERQEKLQRGFGYFYVRPIFFWIEAVINYFGSTCFCYFWPAKWPYVLAGGNRALSVMPLHDSLTRVEQKCHSSIFPAHSITRHVISCKQRYDDS